MYIERVIGLQLPAYNWTKSIYEKNVNLWWIRCVLRWLEHKMETLSGTKYTSTHTRRRRRGEIRWCARRYDWIRITMMHHHPPITSIDATYSLICVIPSDSFPKCIRIHQKYFSISYKMYVWAWKSPPTQLIKLVAAELIFYFLRNRWAMQPWTQVHLWSCIPLIASSRIDFLISPKHSANTKH